MKTFTNLAQLSDYNYYLSLFIEGYIDRSDRHEEFMWSLGGDVHVIETAEDYLKVLKENQFFDISEDINDSWHLLVVINNNSGGPTYFVSRDAIEDSANAATTLV